MPTFTPPVEEGPAPIGGRNHPLWRHYGNFDCGLTVWKDPLGAWHQQMFPYQGGGGSRNYNGTQFTETFDDPNNSLASALEVYMGGSQYEVSDAKAAELRAAGFYVGGHFDSEEQKWVDYAIVSDPNQDYKGGDACSSLKRPDGGSLWTFSDNLIGTIFPSGFYNAVLPTRNALVVQDPAGVIGTQVFNGGGMAFPNPNPSNWWWAIDIGGTNDGTTVGEDVVVACWEVTSTPTSLWGHLLNNTMVIVAAFGFLGATQNISHYNETFLVQDMYKDTVAGFHYILGLEYDQLSGGYDRYGLSTVTYNRLARVPIGQLLTPASWEYWTGTTWSTNGLLSTRLRDNNGDYIEGDSCITKVGDNYIMASLPRITNPIFQLRKSTTPTGPWTYYGEAGKIKLPTAGLTPPDGQHKYAHYLPKFHEHLNPNPSHLVLSYNRNSFPITPGAGGAPITSIHCSTFCPLFIYAPVPT